MSYKSSERQESFKLGQKAEGIAALYLQAKGYKILERRYKCPHGEIDLIASHKGALIFIEVKARPTEDEALYALTPRMQARIVNASMHYLSHLGSMDYEMRYDLISYAGGLKIKHIENAWMPEF